MAASNSYQCQFIDSVNEDFYCKKCNLVARRLTITNCCGESFCQSCITDSQEEGKPCPHCGKKNFTTFEQVKNQKRIDCLRVYCSMKERGCCWSGTREQLDTHLDPDQDNCQYVDTKCPLDCHMAIPKNKVEQHVAQHCAKRPYVCQHCNFKATYEEVVEKHLAECKYVPLQCPNLCGVTFERDFMEDHMKMCRLEEVGCEFSGVGCKDQFRREDQEEHTRQNSQKHLTLTASLAVETKEQLQQKLLEQDKKHKEEEEKMKQKIKELEKNFMEEQKYRQEQEEKLENQKDLLLKQSIKLEEENEKQHMLEMKLEELEVVIGKQWNILEEINEVHKQNLDKHNLDLQTLKQMLREAMERSIKNEQRLFVLHSMSIRKFEMKHFSVEKAKDKQDDWRGPAMYTHVYGYKFCVGVDANGTGTGHGRFLFLRHWAMPGEYDDQLDWPVKATFTIELINQKGGTNAKCIVTREWGKPVNPCYLGGFYHTGDGFVELSGIDCFLRDDTLYFHVSEITMS